MTGLVFYTLERSYNPEQDSNPPRHKFTYFPRDLNNVNWVGRGRGPEVPPLIVIDVYQLFINCFQFENNTVNWANL